LREKGVLGLWTGEHEGARFWASVLKEIRNRGTEGIRMDGFSGFPDAVRAVFPETRIQRCIVHMVRNSRKFVSYKDLKAVCAELKAIYPAPSEEAGRAALEQFGETWQSKYPLIYKSRESDWPDLCEFFKYPEEIRPVICTTNALGIWACHIFCANEPPEILTAILPSVFHKAGFCNSL
jgi:transposase-like protein